MPALDPFQGAAQESEDQKRALLDAVAAAGTAGKAAHLAAKAEVETARTGALNRAQTRANMTGQDFGGTDTAPVTEAADRFGSYFAGQQAASQSQLDQIGASGSSYLAKIGAIAPFMQSQNIQAAADREQGFKTEVAQSQAKIDAAKAKDAADRQHDLQMFNLKDTASRRDTLAKAAAVKPAKPLTKAQLLGAGQTVADDYSQMLNTPNAFTADESARALAAYKGLPSEEVNTILGPRKVPEKVVPQQPPPFNRDWLTGAFRYDGKNISGTKADEVLRAPEVQQAQRFLEMLSVTKLEGGRIDDASAKNYRGMTPRQAFEDWLSEQSGIRTMKAALKDYYGQYLDSLGG